MAIATLSIDLEAKFAKLEEGMRAASAAVQANAKGMQGSLDDLGRTSALVGGLLKGAFIGLATGGAAAAFNSILNGVDALNDLKDATGSSIENLSALEDIGKRTGTSFDSVSSTLVKFNKVLGESKAGSETANLLKSIGLNAEELKRIDPALALQKTAIALQGVAADGQQARIVQELFGKSVKEAAPFLKDLAEAGQLVGTVTTQQAEEAEKFNKQLFDLQKNTVDLARDLTSKLLPALNAIFEGRKTGGVKGALDALGEQIGLGAAFHEERRIKQLKGEIAGIEAQVDQRAKDGPGFLAGIFGSDNGLEEELSAKKRQLDDVYRAFRERNKVESKGFAATAASFGGSNLKPSAPDIPGATQAAKTSELERYIEALERAQLATLDLTKLEEVELEIASGKFKDLTPRAAEYLRVLARGIDLAKQPQDFIGPGIDAGVLKQRADAQRELNKLLEDSGEGKFSGLVDLTNSLIDAQQEGAVTAEQYASAMALLQKRFEDLNPKAKAAEATLTELDEFTKQAARNIQDTLGSTVASALKGDFKSIEDSWKDMLSNMAAQALTAQLSKYLFGDYGKTGNIGGALGALFSKGTGTNSPSPPSVGSIGAGPGIEAMVGRAAAQSVGGGGRPSGAMALNQTVNVGQGVSRGEVTAAVADGNRALLAQLRASGQLR